MSPSARIKRAAITALYIPVHLKIPNGYGCMCDVINGPLLDKPPKSANRNNGTSEADDNSNRMRRVWCDRCVAWIKYSLETDHLGGYCGFFSGVCHTFSMGCAVYRHATFHLIKPHMPTTVKRIHQHFYAHIGSYIKSMARCRQESLAPYLFVTRTHTKHFEIYPHPVVVQTHIHTMCTCHASRLYALRMYLGTAPHCAYENLHEEQVKYCLHVCKCSCYNIKYWMFALLCNATQHRYFVCCLAHTHTHKHT